MTLGKLYTEMKNAGVLGAGKFAKAVEILAEMFGNDEYTNFLSLAGPLVPGGLRLLIRDLIDGDYVHGLITTGANISHDILEAIGEKPIIGSAYADDVSLRRRSISRIYDIYIAQRSIEKLEKKSYRILDKISVQKGENIASYRLLWEIGGQLSDRNSILRTAQRKRVPVFCPGLLDSMIGLNLWTYSQLKSLRINFMLDFSRLVEIIHEAKKVGGIILGGGVPKHHLLISTIFRGGLDSAIQITMDRPESGSSSGAPLEEAISWGKAKNPKMLATIIGDATVLFPVIVGAALDVAKRT